MASTTSSSQMINSKDMVLNENHFLYLTACGPQKIKLLVRIDKNNNDNVYLVDYLGLFRAIEQHVVSGSYEMTRFFDEFEKRPIKSEELNTLIIEKIPVCSHTARWKREINRIFALITSDILLATCKRIQIEGDSETFIEIKRQCYEIGFLHHLDFLKTMKQRYPHIDLSFLKDERFSQEIKDFHSFLRSENINCYRL